jgi:signal transduction histidine kinase
VNRRIVGSFLAVLTGLLLLVVVPMAISLGAQERGGYDRSADSEAHSLAALAEEHFGDPAEKGETAAPGPLRLPVASGDAAAVVLAGGRVAATAGRATPAAEFSRIAAGTLTHVPGFVVSTARIGTDPNRRVGTVVLLRNAAPLDRRIRNLRIGLGVAGTLALIVGAFVAAVLARWIRRPVAALGAAATRMGAGDVQARVGRLDGPPEIQAVATAFDDMADRVGSLLESQRVMTLDVSHQLRTPLSALRLRLELLADDVPPTWRPELLGALTEIARLSRLADGLLAVARAEEVRVTPEAVDVLGAVLERSEAWRPVAQERGITLLADGEAASAWSTPGHLEQVLDNVIANSLDALDTGRRIDITVSTENGRVLLRVADDGPGMSPARREQAFARFASDGSRPGKTGLGLTIVARLVAADRGETRLEQTPGGGLTVVIRLPAVHPGAGVHG